jgi:hypothetical protein
MRGSVDGRDTPGLNLGTAQRVDSPGAAMTGHNYRIGVTQLTPSALAIFLPSVSFVTTDIRAGS